MRLSPRPLSAPESTRSSTPGFEPWDGWISSSRSRTRPSDESARRRRGRRERRRAPRGARRAARLEVHPFEAGRPLLHGRHRCEPGGRAVASRERRPGRCRGLGERRRRRRRPPRRERERARAEGGGGHHATAARRADARVREDDAEAPRHRGAGLSRSERASARDRSARLRPGALRPDALEHGLARVRRQLAPGTADAPHPPRRPRPEACRVPVGDADRAEAKARRATRRGGCSQCPAGEREPDAAVAHASARGRRPGAAVLRENEPPGRGGAGQARAAAPVGAARRGGEGGRGERRRRRLRGGRRRRFRAVRGGRRGSDPRGPAGAPRGSRREGRCVG